ncbi:MAG: ABC transporter ATP-binding protein [Gemmatimonadetes bacterium]|nr:ABC transporter ATP-binding protein [Gemmatimonadota bacterium]MYJ96461.1 ABC transporter ATP-binding protein [Pseudomonadota bacterium]
MTSLVPGLAYTTWSMANLTQDRGYVWANDVSASYGGIRKGNDVLRGLSFSAQAGDITAIVGPNGAGKTTLFRVLMGFLPVHEGHCRVAGVDPARYRRTRGIGYVPESTRFPTGWTGMDLLRRAVDLGIADRDQREQALMCAIEQSGLQLPVLSKEARRYSHGTQRRLALAHALIGDPDVLILDEPFAGLDPPARKSLRREMDSARTRGAVVLVSTHDLSEVARSADRIVFVEAGLVKEIRDLTAEIVLSGAGLEQELLAER